MVRDVETNRRATRGGRATWLERLTRNSSAVVSAAPKGVSFVASDIRPSATGAFAGSRLRAGQLRCAGEEIGHLRIAHLVEVAIVEADCAHHNEGLERDSLVGLLAELGERLRCGYWRREHQMRRITPP